MDSKISSKNTSSVGQILLVYSDHWRLFLTFILVALLLGVSTYLFSFKYRAVATVTINDAQNSSLQAFSQQFFGFSKSLQEGKKGSGTLNRHTEFLKTREFYSKLAQRVGDLLSNKDLSEADKISLGKLVDNKGSLSFGSVESSDFESYLERIIKMSATSSSEITVQVLHRERATAIFLANRTAEIIVEVLKEREKEDLNQVEAFIKEQLQITETKIAKLATQLNEEQMQNRFYLPSSSQEKLAEYASELSIRAEEIQLKISENESVQRAYSTIELHQDGSSLYGAKGELERLALDTKLLREKLWQVQKLVRKVRAEVKMLPIANLRLEQLQKKSDFEFLKFKDLSATLTKLDAQKLSLDSKFQVLEYSLPEKTSPQDSLAGILGVSFIAALFSGFTVIYLKVFWAASEGPSIYAEDKINSPYEASDSGSFAPEGQQPLKNLGREMVI